MAKHTYFVYLDNLYDPYSFVEIQRDSCPKNGEIITIHEGYGYFQNYKIKRIYNSEEKVERLVAFKNGSIFKQ